MATPAPATAMDRDVKQLAARPSIQVDGVWVFAYLQLLDLLTTAVGFQVGLSEASPFIRWMMEGGPMLAILISKGIALGLGAVCIATHRRRVILWMNFWFALLVVWNLALILHTLA